MSRKISPSRTHQDLAVYQGERAKGPPVQTVCKKEAPIERLPIELLISIFHQCPSDVAARLDLAHVCRHWALIARNTPSLWTDINIRVKDSWNAEHFQKFSVLVGMQIERSAGQLLNITWTYNTRAKYRKEIFHFMLQRAPCEQWKSLKMEIEGEPAEDELLLAREVVFPNLESLQVLSGHIISIIHAIERTKSPKLQKLDLQHLSRIPSNTYTSYTEILSHITDLYLPLHIPSTKPRLPPNISTLCARRCDAHIFPHIRNYKLEHCRFRTSSTIDLQRLTNLHVGILLDIYANCEVSLPSLRHLTHQHIRLGQGARLHLPILETLHIPEYPSCMGYDIDGRRYRIRNMTPHPGYLLSPSKRIVLEMYIPPNTILQLLSKCTDVEEVTLSFREQQIAMEMMDRIMPGYSLAMEHSTTAQVASLCPRMRTLRLRFAWPISDVGVWRERAVEIVKERRWLEVLALWKGKGSYVRLA